jgi:hypothetical protein
MVIPEFDLCQTVTLFAERKKVLQSICFKVVVEEMIWPHMVHHELPGSKSLAATPTDAVISFQGPLSLFMPIRTPVLSMSSHPCRVVLTCPVR